VEEAKKHAGGRPKGSSKYDQKFDHIAYVACAEGGFTLPKIAKLLSVARSTVAKWMLEQKSFSDAIKKGRDEFDCATAENCLLKRITGYKYKETTSELVGGSGDGGETKSLIVTKVVEKSMAPDVAGIIFFLRNRNRERWPDIRSNEVAGKNGGPIRISHEDALALLDGGE